MRKTYRRDLQKRPTKKTDQVHKRLCVEELAVAHKIDLQVFFKKKIVYIT